jgi:outer membrane protein TolC
MSRSPGHLGHASLLLALILVTRVAAAQDTLRLSTLQSAAVQADPRAEQYQLLRSATDLRLGVLGSERLPQATINGWASHQSDVTTPKQTVPGLVFPDLPKDRWESTVDVEQLLYDGGNLSQRRRLEQARHDESAAGIAADLYGLQSEVNGAFFSAFLLQQRAAEYDALITDLDARLASARARVEAGTALSRDAGEIEAERVRASVDREQARASRRASLAVLADLVGRPIDTTAVLLLPTQEPEKTYALSSQALAELRQRPEFERLRRSRQRLQTEAALAGTENRPRLSAFGQAGLGLPGLDQFRTTPDGFWQAGLRVEWRPWTWQSAGRTAEALQLEQQSLERDERAFARSLARQVASTLEDIARLSAALSQDQRVVLLRTDIERQARAQYDEGSITTADYVEARTDVLEARLTLQRHRVELAQARATYLTTLGLAPSEGAQQP